MTILPIVTWPNKILREVSTEVTDFSDEVRQLCNDMVDTMHAAEGIGLAAIQVGHKLRIAVIDARIKDVVRDIQNEDTTPSIDDSDPELAELNEDVAPLILINPKIKQFSKDKSTYEEGCLSLPGVCYEVERPNDCEIEYYDENGLINELECFGLMSVCVQHEIDHLNGRMFFDRVGVAKRQMILQKYAKNQIS